MIKWRKRIPILVVTLSALALCVAVLSFATTEDQKEDYVQQLNAIRSTSQAEVLHPDVVAKLEMEAEIQAKLEAEEEGSTYPTKDNELGTSSIAGHPVVKYDPGSVAFEQDFEGAEFPPPGWDTINTDPGYGFFLGTYAGGGTQAALVTWHAAGYQQDEWLLSPTVNLTGYTSALRLEFWFLQGYSYPHDFKIYVDDGSGMTEIWDSDTTGYPSFTWWKYTIDMSAYIGETVQIGFQYYGEDADLFGIDDIVLTDEGPAVGRCCYGDPSAPECDDVTEEECEAMGGYSWDEDLNCTDNPCPVAPENDDCHDVTPDALPATWTGNNEGATYDDYCQWFGDYPNVWHGFTIEECMDITIEYCGCPAGWGNGWLNLITDCDCPDGTLLSYTSFDWGCANGNPRIYFDHLDAGTYYYPVMLDPSNGAVGDYELYVYGTPCPEPQPGDNCDNPIKVDIPSLPWSDIGQTTCGRLNDYDETCLGYYDGGEDIIYEVAVSSAVTVNITLDPKGTTWTGIALSTDCPPMSCLAQSTSSSGDPHGMTCVSLDPGVYYIMVDTWPSPDCIPDFDLHIVDTTCEAIENDDCADATAINEVVDLAFSTETATFDGGGTCLYSPNIWYCYTATETGIGIITLCGSLYDTKLAVYYGCACDPLGTELGCNDDSPCDFTRALQSTVEIPVTAGNSYLVEVGGYSSNTGTGVLNIWVEEPCDVVCSGTPEGEPCINDDEEDVTNGGCNSVPPVWGTIDCDETVCGEWNTYLFTGLNYRDTDWYKFTLTQCYDVTITAVGEFPLVTGFLEQVIDGGGWDCSNFTGYISPYATGDDCDTVVVQRLAMAPGDYAIFVGGTVYSGFDCFLGTFEYSVSVDCVPVECTYCAASGGCDEYIENVTFETINNTTGCDEYGDYTALSATVQAGNSYPISITIGNGYSSDTGAVYVDWNQDLDFYDPGEIQSLNPGAGSGPYSGTVTVPGDALLGDTRMRIRLSWNTDPVPCGTQTYGEVEDYTINVTPPTIHLDPCPFYAFMAWSVDPMSGAIYLADNFEPGYSVNDIDLPTVMVNGSIVPTSTTIIPSYPYMVGPVLEIVFPMLDFILSYGLLYGETMQAYTVTGAFTDATPFTESGQCTYFGHKSGDLNVDGEVNVADLTYFVEYIFRGGPAPEIMELADVDGSGGSPNIGDLTYLVDFLFRGGQPPMHQ